MLNLTGRLTTDALSDLLANLVATLHPDAGLGGAGAALETARGAIDLFLRELRHHLHENNLLMASLVEADSTCGPRLQAISREHLLLKQLSHDLCGRIRNCDLGAARDVARRYLAILLDHGAHEARVLKETVRLMNERSTARFAEALFERMLRDAARNDRAHPSREAVADLHSLYVRLTHHLQNHSDIPSVVEADHEHSCSR